MGNKSYKLIHGDALEQVKRLDSESVDCVISSPPYYQLRDYGFEGQIGLEKTFQEYLEKLWLLMDEVKRVLKPTGTVWINLGDTYGTQSGAMRDGKFGAKNTNNQQFVQPRLTHKSLLLIPHRFAIGCSERGWLVRNDIVWAKRNGMPESVTDRFSKKHEYFFLMAKQGKYYFDLDAVRDEHKEPPIKRIVQTERKFSGTNYGTNGTGIATHSGNSLGHPRGKNPGTVSDFWDIPTRPSSAKHYATFNTELIDKPIKAGCPEFVCKACGKPREKMVKSVQVDRNIPNGHRPDELKSKNVGGKMDSPEYHLEGYTDCGCNAGFEGGTILDMFCGTATTGVRALQLDRKFIGIDGNAEYLEIAKARIESALNKQPLFATA